VKVTSLELFVVSSGPCGADTRAKFNGKATVNDVPDQNVEMTVDDCSEPGSADTFKIVVTGRSQFGFSLCRCRSTVPSQAPIARRLTTARGGERVAIAAGHPEVRTRKSRLN
jgi:hypothetical protein